MIAEGRSTEVLSKFLRKILSEKKVDEEFQNLKTKISNGLHQITVRQIKGNKTFIIKENKGE